MSDDLGTLYVLANTDHSLAKVGLTRNGTPDTRADAYSAAHGVRWHTYWSATTRNVAQAEAAAHRALQDRRFSLLPEAREIFHCTPHHAMRIAERYVVAPAGTPAFSSRRDVNISPVLAHIWPVCREALVAIASVGLARAFNGPTRGPVKSAVLQLLSRALRRL